jgi:hypothetical protein
MGLDFWQLVPPSQPEATFSASCEAVPFQIAFVRAALVPKAGQGRPLQIAPAVIACEQILFLATTIFLVTYPPAKEYKVTATLQTETSGIPPLAAEDYSGFGL